MSITGVVRYGRLFARNLELRRTITSRSARTRSTSSTSSPTRQRPVPHAWLLHINLGYPLVQEGTEFCYDSPKVEPTPTRNRRFKRGARVSPRRQARYKTARRRSTAPRVHGSRRVPLPARRPRRASTTVGVVNETRAGLGHPLQHARVPPLHQLATLGAAAST
jgi:hypothetical protein